MNVSLKVRLYSSEQLREKKKISINFRNQNKVVALLQPVGL